MMSLRDLLSSDVKSFIHQHENDDVKPLVLKHKFIHGIPSSVIADQINGRRKAKEKLPMFYHTKGIVYPPGVNVEQSSSEQTAGYKATIFAQHSAELKNKTLVDLTGGLGIDSFFLSRTFKNVQYIEPNESLLEISKHNHHQLGADNIQYHHTTAENFLSRGHSFDLAYIDPSRRAAGNQKVYSLNDCEPNIVQLQDVIFEKADCLMIKASPLFDIQQGLKELKFVQQVFVVSVNNECKELLFSSRKNFSDEPEILAINISSNNRIDSFSFQFSRERQTEIPFSDPLTYLYEPNASILKSGAFKTLGVQFNISKIHPSTHLYTSDQYLENFSGRKFKIEAFVKPDAKTLKAFFPEGKANITTRNYPLSVDELKKKTGLKDGGDKFLIGFSGMKTKYLVSANRLH
ncbi:MAG TPA: RsmD family RNA methyltransferase [Chryseolinea sp.]|nr:RsmD family RNA methyltransferase [Chryseolinea sp.]HPH45797.1 RsmD family RNA methyltransferase [Chryseolinea sp.]HPM28867.1 RsmD family RNA methyltransferase [Chryseolinea sp.]